MLVADWCAAARSDDMVRMLGVETISHAPDWEEWIADHPVDLLVVHGAVAAHRFGWHLDRAYPGVPRIVDSIALVALGDPTPLAPLSGDDRGHSITLQAARDRDIASLSAATVVSCASAHEATVIGGLTRAPIKVLRGYVSPPEIAVPGSLRRDVAVAGSFVEGVCSPDEDAALFLASEVMPRVWRDVDATLHVFGEDASPSVRSFGGNVRYHADRDACMPLLQNVRAVVSVRRFGRGATSAPFIAADAGVPLIVGPLVAESFDLPSDLCVADDVDALAGAIRACLLEDSSWTDRARTTRQWADAVNRDQYRAALDELLDTVGIPVPRSTGNPSPVPWLARSGRRWIAAPEHRSAPSVDRLDLALEDQVTTDGVPDPEALLTFPLESPYHEWVRAREPSPRQRWAHERRAASLPYRPLVSLVLPVRDTAPEDLTITVGSIQAQVYPRWEIIVADDGSSSPSTLAELQELAVRVPRLRLVRSASPVGTADVANAAFERARGEYVAVVPPGDHLEPRALLEVVDLLNRAPELDVVYTDEHQHDVTTGRRINPSLKPSWSPDLLRSTNYVGRLAVFRLTLVRRLGGLRSEFAGALDYDLVLRATHATDRIGHVAEPLYRSDAGNVAALEDVDAGRRALVDAVAKADEAAEVVDIDHQGTFRVRYSITGHPRVSIVIATRDRRDLIEHAIASIRTVSTYENIEIVIIDNQSRDPSTLSYLERHDGPVLRYDAPFNYARMMNLGIAEAHGDLVVLLNNDIEVRQPDWIEAMVEHAQRRSVGAVGVKLEFPSGAVQHQGIFVGGGGGAANLDFAGAIFDGDDEHFIRNIGSMVANFSAVTAACMMARPAVLAEVGGFDERLHVAFNDVDLCLKLRARGYDIVYTPFASVVHEESATRGAAHPMENDDRFRTRWAAGRDYQDPYCNPNYDQHRRFALTPTWADDVAGGAE